ncbi:Uncharacterized protein FWK35_00004117, partial [Aphis craccivora]
SVKSLIKEMALFKVCKELELIIYKNNISQKSIEEKLIEVNCPINQKTIVQEIFSAAKVNNSKGRRYSHEWLILYEISVREALTVCSKSLTYKGLVDFGEDYKAKQSGAIIHGFVSDGAQTNRKMWSKLGISGQVNSFKNWYQHPLREDRKYAFSDTPSLFKNVRNKLYNDKILKVLSNSVANGLMFYKKYNIPGLNDCDPTSEFCQKFNDCFDALDRKFGAEGLRVNGKDYQIKSEFLSDSTACGLRITIQSTLELFSYLKSCWDFKYLLTGKINQDNIEMFFGTIWQAVGQNDHPSTPNFLQLYKLLSTYSILKPTKSENCTVQDDSPLKPIISMTDLKDIYQPQKYNLVENLKTKLNNIIEEKEWELNDVVEHDYIKPLPIKTTVEEIEKSFMKHCSSTHVFDLIIDDIINEKHINNFPCVTHGENIISFAVIYYVRMRMRQFTYQENKNKKKLEC